jgi:hypothetical protein
MDERNPLSGALAQAAPWGTMSKPVPTEIRRPFCESQHDERGDEARFAIGSGGMESGITRTITLTIARMRHLGEKSRRMRA